MTGTATDNGGGVVGGVESLDGRRRHVAPRQRPRPTGRSPGRPARRARSTSSRRAVDDSGNLEVPTRRRHASPSARVTVTCPCSIWAPTQTPDHNRRRTTRAPSKLGTRFRADVNGFITAIRFYKSTAEHRPAHRQSVDGRRRRCWRRSTFVGEIGVGMAGGHAADSGRDHCQHDLRRLVSHERRASTPATTATSRTAASTTGRCMRRGTASPAPTASTSTARPASRTRRSTAENYWVDVVFVTSIAPDTTPPTVASTTPANGASGVADYHDGHSDCSARTCSASTVDVSELRAAQQLEHARPGDGDVLRQRRGPRR